MFQNKQRTLTLKDIAQFLSGFQSKSSEGLLCWLGHYNIFDLVDLMALINGKFALPKEMRGRKQNNDPFAKNFQHGSCKCTNVYNTFDKTFKRVLPLKNVANCIKYDEFVPTAVNEVEIEAANQMYHFREQTKELSTKTCFTLKPKFLNYDVIGETKTLKEVILNLHDFSWLLNELDIIELYALYKIKQEILPRMFANLLPEYIRKSERNTIVMKNTKQSEQVFIKELFDFYSGGKIYRFPTQIVASFKLPVTVCVKRDIIEPDKYLIQPNFRGFRLGIGKQLNRIYQYNIHNFKVCHRLWDSDWFCNVSLFSGEFIVIGFDAMTEQFKDVNKYSKTVKLILLDLFIHGDENYLNLTPLDRYKKMQHFINVVNNDNVLLCPLLGEEDIGEYRANHSTELLNTKQVHCNGIVFRLKAEPWTRLYPKIKFTVARFDIIERDQAESVILIEDEKKIISINGSIMPFVEAKYAICLPMYLIDQNLLYLCIFDGAKYIKYLTLKTSYLEKKDYFGTNLLRVGGQSYSYCVAKIYFNIYKDNTLKDVTLIELRPDLSLLDCVSLSDLQDRKKI